jgi:outer membrane lipoprotein-sorting protein
MKLFLTIAFLLIFMPAAIAEAPLPEVTAVEAYLNGISTLRARFVQTANDGQQTSGTFMLKRPGRLRFEYDPPVKDFIVADGRFVHYYDGQMKQESSAPISRSLADFFLRENLKLSGGVSVSDIKREDGLLYMTLLQSKDPLAGSLTLMFGENPLELKKWRIVDAQGQVTNIELSGTKQGITLKDKLFHYYDPERKELFINK